MYKCVILLPLVLATACGNSSQTRGEQSSSQAEVTMLPARTLNCTLGRALNLDSSKRQTLADIRYEGAHSFKLFLPSIPVRQGPAPDPSADPEPIDPATKILDDPAGLAKDMNGTFDRVVDMWPERVEIARAIDPPLTRLIIISDIDTVEGTANLFMAPAADAGSIDLKKVYQGRCAVEIVKARG
jgi:hypothetical protein